MKNVIKIFHFVVQVFPLVIELLDSLKKSKPKKQDTPPPVHEVEIDKVE